jgi:hypothetical protein
MRRAGPSSPGFGPPNTRTRILTTRADALEQRALLAPLIVTNTNDSGAGSLRQAILAADAAPGSQTIA